MRSPAAYDKAATPGRARQRTERGAAGDDRVSNEIA